MCLSETGQVIRRALARTIDEMMRILEGLPKRFEVCYEANCGYDHLRRSAAAIGRNPTDITLPTVGSQAGGSGDDEDQPFGSESWHLVATDRLLDDLLAPGPLQGITL